MDRIDEAYYGHMGEEFMRKTRERLHWMCSRVEGRDVLDVGCSQGTFARILAPFGKFVTSIDLNSEAIAYAERKMVDVDPAVRERIQYQCVNFMDFESSTRFDTIVIGEVLEHLAAPEHFLRKAYEQLKRGGRIVVTVPFGINDDPDHRQTFYWTWIEELVSPLFEVKEINYFGKWLGVVGVKRERRCAAAKVVPLSVVKELEKAFYGIERPLVNDGKAKGQRLVEQKTGLDETKKTLAQANLAVKTAQEAQRKATTAFDAETAKQKAALAAEQGKVKDLNSKLAATRSELASVKNEALELRVSLDAEKKISAGETEQIAVLKAALQFAASRQPNENGDTRLLEYSQEIRELRNVLDEKRDEAVERAERAGILAGKVEALTVEKDSLRSNLADAEKRLSEAREEIVRAAADKSAMDKELTAARAELAVAKDSAAVAERKIAEQARDLEKALDRASVLESETSGLKGAVETAVAAKAEVDSELMAARTELAAAKDAVAEDERRIAEQEEELASAKGAADSLRARAELLEAQLAETKAQRLSEIERLKAANSKASAELASLRTARDSDRAATQKARADAAREIQNLTKALTRETALHRKYSAMASRTNKLLAALQTKYDLLTNSKLGRLILGWWSIKDRLLGRKKSRPIANGVPSSANVQKALPASLPVETWALQRENEKRYFAE